MVAGQKNESTQLPTSELPENVNQADFSYIGEPNTVFNLNSYYADVGVDANVTIKEAGAVKVPDEMTTALPRADRELQNWLLHLLYVGRGRRYDSSKYENFGCRGWCGSPG